MRNIGDSPTKAGPGWGGTYKLDANVGNYAELFVTFRTKVRARARNLMEKCDYVMEKCDYVMEQCDFSWKKVENGWKKKMYHPRGVTKQVMPLP